MYPYQFTVAQRQKALYYLCFWHVLVIAASNYLVQFPIQLGPIDNTWGAFTYPFIFLTTDLTVRIFGSQMARKIILWVMLPALALSYVVSALFVNGQWSGFAAIGEFHAVGARIALASFTAYVVAQLLDIGIFNRLRQSKRWWAAPAAASSIGSAIDTLVFFAVAFYASSDAFMAANWPSIAVADFVCKILIGACLFLPLYGVLLQYLTRKLTLIKPETTIASNHS